MSGQDRKKQRRAARKKRNAKVEKVRQDMTAAAVERNASIPRGRQVTTGDVSAHALPGHAKCGGRGMVGVEMACPCATKRFLRRHPGVIVVMEGDVARVYWPASVPLAAEEPKGEPDGR
jgi:hypothetical protein